MNEHTPSELQLLPSGQSSAQVAPHVLSVPPPPHVNHGSSSAHVSPQSSVPPQPSESVPHSAAAVSQVSGSHAHALVSYPEQSALHARAPGAKPRLSARARV